MDPFPFDLHNLEYILSLFKDDPKYDFWIHSDILEHFQRYPGLQDADDHKIAVTKCCHQMGIEPTEDGDIIR